MLAHDLNLRKMIIASDCLEIVNNIKKGVASSYASILKEIEFSRRNFESVHFCFEHRESNFEVRSFAKGASSLSVGRHVWLRIVPDIACIPNVLNFE